MSVRPIIAVTLLLSAPALAQVLPGLYERVTTDRGLPLEVPMATPETAARLIPAMNVQERQRGQLLVLDGAGEPLNLDLAEIGVLFPEMGDGATQQSAVRCADGRKLRILRSWHSVPREVWADTVWLHHVLRFERDGVMLDVGTLVSRAGIYRVVGTQRCHADRCPTPADAALAAAWCPSLEAG